MPREGYQNNRLEGDCFYMNYKGFLQLQGYIVNAIYTDDPDYLTVNFMRVTGSGDVLNKEVKFYRMDN